MSDTGERVGKALRLIASGGWADQDATVVEELLTSAQELATRVLADEGASAESRSAAQDLLDRLTSDTY
jgi:hypothetical protein